MIESFDRPYLLVTTVTALLVLFALQRRRIGLTPALAVMSALGISSAWLLREDFFHFLRLLAWLCFVFFPLCSLLVGLMYARRQRAVAIGYGLAAVVSIAAGVQAFVIEPHDLQVTRHTVETAKLTSPIRIVVLADIQTDDVGAYEEKVFALAADQEPDMVLMPGDYVQPWPEQRTRQQRRMNRLMREFRPRARLGVWAVQGNVEREGWKRIFSNTPIGVIDATTSVTLGEVTVTGLSLEDSFDTMLDLEPQPGFHILFGHGPDFALADPPADLLVAGHTHGGQVSFPLVGPPITFSKIPRSQARGLTRLAPGRHLVVSAGIGHEREYAPRMRFGSPPEIVVIDVVPTGG